MRCPACDARNAEDAAWCTQCFERFSPGPGGTPAVEAATRPGAQDPTTPPRPTGPEGAARTDATSRPGQERDVPDRDVADRDVADRDVPDRDVRVDGEVVEWRCATCGAWNPLEAPACHRCATPRSGFGPASAPASGSAAGHGRVALPGALLASALLPGLGHILQGATGTGLGRALLWVLWGGGGLSLLRTAGVSAGAVVLVLSALCLWAVSLLDLQRAAAGAPPIATGRMLAWSVVVVTLLLVVAVMATSVGGAG